MGGFDVGDLSHALDQHHRAHRERNQPSEYPRQIAANAPRRVCRLIQLAGFTQRRGPTLAQPDHGDEHDIGDHQDRSFDSPERAVPHEGGGNDPGDQPADCVALDAAAERDRHDPGTDARRDRDDRCVRSDHIAERNPADIAYRIS